MRKPSPWIFSRDKQRLGGAAVEIDPLIARRQCSTHDNSNQSYMPILSLLVEEISIRGKKLSVPPSKNKVYNTVNMPTLLTTRS